MALDRSTCPPGEGVMSQLKYERIAESLRARIADGEFAPGAELPSGRALRGQWGVSRATVIRAFEILRGEGLVSARQGQGFRVAGKPPARPAGPRGAGVFRAAGGRPFRRLGAPVRQVPPARIAAELLLAADVAALRGDRLVLSAGGVPFELVTAWFPPDIADAAPRLAQSGPIAGGTVRYVERQTGRLAVRGRDLTAVRPATAAEAHSLERDLPLTVVVVLHGVYDGAGAALVVEEGRTPSDLWESVEEYAL